MTILPASQEVRKGDSPVYVAVNRVWPGELPALTGPEAVTAAKRIWRKFTGKPCPHAVKVTSGNRHNWLRGKWEKDKRGRKRRMWTLYVNPDRGWHHLVHDLSHLLHWKLHPEQRPHDNRHAYLERNIREYVLERGWLNGKLKRPKKPKPERNIVVERAARIDARVTAWETKLKRAQTALKKLRKQQKYYQSKLGG